MNLENKTVFITGGTSGYGKAAAKMLTEHGASVIIAARNESALIAAKEDGICADFIKMDVTVPSDWERACGYITDKYKKIDILINNAGSGVSIVDTVDQKIEDIDKTIMLNLNSVIYGSKIFGRVMKEQKDGLIINMSSVCAKEAWPSWSVYAAAKWGVLGFSKGLYVELQPFGVRVTCMIPAAASTCFNKNSGIPDAEHLLTAEDIAQAITDICLMPKHVCVEEMTVWGTDQVVNPL